MIENASGGMILFSISDAQLYIIIEIDFNIFTINDMKLQCYVSLLVSWVWYQALKK